MGKHVAVIGAGGTGQAAAAKLLNLNEDKMPQTIGVAGVMTPIVTSKHSINRSDIYHYQHGLTCRDGVVSALIAQKGVSQLYDMLDGDNGYWTSVSDQCDWDWMTKSLGQHYFIMDTYFKHWPANMWIQQPLDAVDGILKAEEITAENVEEVIVEPVFQKRVAHEPAGFPSNVEAQFSIPFCLASFLLDPKQSPYWYVEDKLRDPKVLELSGRIKSTGPTLKMSEAFDMFSAGEYPEVSVRIMTKDGRTLKNSVHFPKGHPKNRLTYDEYRDRFRVAASNVLKPDRIEAAIEKILKLETWPMYQKSEI